MILLQSDSSLFGVALAAVNPLSFDLLALISISSSLFISLSLYIYIFVQWNSKELYVCVHFIWYKRNIVHTSVALHAAEMTISKWFVSHFFMEFVCFHQTKRLNCLFGIICSRTASHRPFYHIHSHIFIVWMYPIEQSMCGCEGGLGLHWDGDKWRKNSDTMDNDIERSSSRKFFFMHGYNLSLFI